MKLKIFYYKFLFNLYYDIYIKDIFNTTNKYKFLSFIIFLSGIFSTISFGTIATIRHNNILYPPLLDILHFNYSLPVFIPDYLCIYFVFDNILNIILGNINFYKYIKIWGLYYLLRGITIYITYIPNALDCSLKNHQIMNSIFHPSLVYCSDMMFSGHFFYGLYSCFFRENYNYIYNKKIFYINRFILILYALTIIISKLHYSIDLIMAYFVFSYLYIIIN